MLRRVALLAALVLALAASPSPATGTTDPGERGTAATGCTEPPPADLSTTLQPPQLQERYGIDELVASGYDGRGQTAALVEVNQSVDQTALDQFAACTGLPQPPQLIQNAVPGSTVPAPSPSYGEAQGDAESLITGAPGIEAIYVVVIDDLDTDLPAALAALVDGSLTGGEQVDVASLSFGSCTTDWDPADIEAAEAAFEQVTEAGIWFFKAAGDAGSSDCTRHPQCEESAEALAVGYPAASPWVTAVGGVQLDEGYLGPPTVWNESDYPADPDSCTAGGGAPAPAELFPTPGYQQDLPGDLLLGSRGVPDVSALAGAPYYLNLDAGGLWRGVGGTSLAAPLYAGLTASARTALTDASLTPPASFNDAIYAFATDPARYERVFTDVTTGDNDMYGIGCCTATNGYDLASGLGELRGPELAEALAAASTPPGPTTTTATPTSRAATAAATPRFTG